MDRPLAVGATSGSISALVLKLLAGLSDPSSPLSCPDCPVCFEGLLHLEQVDLPSVVLGLIILLRFLDKHKRLTLAPEQKVRADRCCGAFSLLKDAQKDRLIIDARPANAVEPTLSNWTKTLGSISALLQLELLPGHKLYMSGADLKDYYYCFAVSPARSLRNALRIPIDQQFARELSCFDEKLHGVGKLYSCLFTLAMGDCNAVEIGQMSHINLGISARAFSPHELLGVHSRAPEGR